MTRTTRLFEKYQDFFEKSTSKASLASLCVSLRSLMLEWESFDTEIKTVGESSFATAGEATAAIRECRDARKTRMSDILSPIFKARNQGFKESDFLERWTKPSDVFINITESDMSEEDPNFLRQRTESYAF